MRLKRFYQQIENSNIANEIHGFTIDYSKFILKISRRQEPTLHTIQACETEDNVRRETQGDPVLAQDYEMTSKGWPYNHDPELDPFFMRIDEIKLQSGCLM